MAKYGGNIYKRKDGRWEGRVIKEYNEKGKALYAYFYGRSYKVAFIINKVFKFVSIGRHIQALLCAGIIAYRNVYPFSSVAFRSFQSGMSVESRS